MAKNIYGGGSQTNLNGLAFEQETNLEEALLKIGGYQMFGNKIYYNEEEIGMLLGKNKLYKFLLEPNSVDYTKIISKKLMPDEALYLYKHKKIFIIEKKFQNVGGSVDEKLQTCDFKKKQYTRLLTPLNISVEYIYVFNNWFRKHEYTDVLTYINDSGCHYYYNEIPLAMLQLPH